VRLEKPCEQITFNAKTAEHFPQALQAPQPGILSKINLKADLLFTRGFGRLATQQVVRRQKIGQTA